MEYLLLVTIKDELRDSIEVKPIGNNKANVFIEASSIEAASNLLLQVEASAEDVIRTWKQPQKEEAKEAQPVAHKTQVDAIKADIEGYTATPEGAKLIKTLEAAKEFCYKKTSRIIKNQELNYLYSLFLIGEGLDAINNAYNLAYRRGYNLAKRERKDKSVLC